MGIIKKGENWFLDIKKKSRVWFEDLAKLYLAYSRTNKKSFEKGNKHNLKNLLSFFQGKYLSEITPLLVGKYKSLRKQEVSGASVNRELAGLKHI